MGSVQKALKQLTNQLWTEQKNRDSSVTADTKTASFLKDFGVFSEPELRDICAGWNTDTSLLTEEDVYNLISERLHLG